MEKGYASSHLENLKTASKRLDCSQSVTRGLCREGILDCIKIEGSWYVNPDSLKKAVSELQRKRSNKQISLSKLRKIEISALKNQPRKHKKLIGIEINLKYE